MEIVRVGTEIEEIKKQMSDTDFSTTNNCDTCACS